MIIKEPDFDFDELIYLPDEHASGAASVVRDASSEGLATRAGLQTNSLQSAMDNYAAAMNKSAIAKSTGLPVKTSSQQYKGFIAEEYFKHTLKINALSKGIPDWKIGVYTNGPLPDNSVLTGIDEHVDISIWTRKHPWSKPMRTVDYQSKIFNDSSKYKKVFDSPKYKEVKHVGGAGQGVNEKLSAPVGREIVESDSITPADAVIKADQAKAQNTPEYEKRQEKLDELNKVNIGRAIAAGAVTGAVLSAVQEIVSVIKDSGELSEEKFITKVDHILRGTVEGGIEGGVRGGAIAGAVQLMGKMLGREVAANSLEAIPGMVVANVTVDFAKDLYKCFVTKTIDTDDLLCSTVNNVFSSAAGFCGAWVAGQAAGQIAAQFSSQAFTQSVSLFASAKASAATGAAIGSSLVPIGTVIGSAVGGIIIGFGANALINTANQDAAKAFTECIEEINSHIELNGCAKAFYFADSMESISDFKLSFKDLLPCYNLISDLKEYNLHQKAIRSVEAQLSYDFDSIDAEKKEALIRLEKQHISRMNELQLAFENQRSLMTEDFRESINTFVATSYMQYLDVYQVIQGNAEALLLELENRKTEHSAILGYMHHRNEVNEQINILLAKLMSDNPARELLPFIEKITWFMNQDLLLVGRQYLSFDEAIYLIGGEIV